ncbi:hypothetical protein F5Y10DRAFT_266124 [Nemania abortiva]|nr:hypothetical protein F5Y10DRAFT_266124 [Nemania abortiva]
MSSVLVSTLALTSVVSTTTVVAILSPNTIKNLIVHGYMIAVAVPIIKIIIKIPLGISRSYTFTGLTRTHSLTILSGVLILCYSVCSQYVGSILHPELEPAHYKETAKQLWFEGFPIPKALSVYQSAFEGISDSNLFWRILLPLLIIQWAVDWVRFIYLDFFILFKDLGLGGSGTTFYGYALARFRAHVANINVLQPPRVPQTLDPWRGRLSVLPGRQGPRPTIEGVTPQRQTDFPSPPNTTLAIEALYDEFVTPPDAAGEDRIVVRRSYLEPGLLALRREITAVPTDEQGGPLDLASVPLNSRDAFGGEIYHTHREGTSHVILHPADCRRVIEAGWGERHPFCTDAWWWKLWFRYRGGRLPVPEHLMILYAPRHQGEYAVIREIMRAAVWHATEGRLHPLTVGTYPIPQDPNAAA